MSESSRVIPAALIEFTARGARIFRNFVGGVWAGRKVAEGPDWVKIKGARHIAAGLRPGSSDLIGWMPVTTQAGYSQAQIVAAFLAGRDSRPGSEEGKKALAELLALPGMVPDFQAQTFAIFTAVECKTEAYKTLTDDQENFLDQVVGAGGLGYVAREDGDGIRVCPWPEEKT